MHLLQIHHSQSFELHLTAEGFHFVQSVAWQTVIEAAGRLLFLMYHNAGRNILEAGVPAVLKSKKTNKKQESFYRSQKSDLKDFFIGTGR